MDTISYENLVRVIKNLPNGKAAEIGPGSAVINKDIIGDVNWVCTALVWYLNSHIVAEFTNKFTAGLCLYFLKALHHCLPVTVRKCLYNRDYPSVLCFYCGEVESSDYSFVCVFDSGIHKDLLAFYLAKWHAMFSLGFSLSWILQVLFLCASDDVLYITLSKDFLFRDWYLKAVSALDDAKFAEKIIINFVQSFGAAYHVDIWLVRTKYRVFIEKYGLILYGGSVFLVIQGLLFLLLAGVVRLLKIAEMLGVHFGFRKLCCFFSGIDSVVSVIIDL
ncbi:hypothetical protein G9A89_008057 [Geosiphon pyriformis]|nr:hypothetical protein G9A89_008057 [Geosiphon pyriformis]